jgi:hypothetical protein
LKLAMACTVPIASRISTITQANEKTALHNLPGIAATFIRTSFYFS